MSHKHTVGCHAVTLMHTHQKNRAAGHKEDNTNNRESAQHPHKSCTSTRPARWSNQQHKGPRSRLLRDNRHVPHSLQEPTQGTRHEVWGGCVNGTGVPAAPPTSIQYGPLPAKARTPTHTHHSGYDTKTRCCIWQQSMHAVTVPLQTHAAHAAGRGAAS